MRKKTQATLRALPRHLRCAIYGLGLALCTGAAWSADDSGSVPAEDQKLVVRLAPDAFVPLSEEDLRVVFNMVDPVDGALMFKERAELFPSYEMEVIRQERMDGKWAQQPDHMLVRYLDKPRRMYIRWLDDSPHAGQELIYDETKKKDQMYGHFGGLLGVVSIWIDIDGTIAARQSNHKITELGVQYIVETLSKDAATYKRHGLDGRPTEIKRVDDLGLKLVALTFEPPKELADEFYAPRAQVMFDTNGMLPRVVNAWNADGTQREHIAITRFVPKRWSDATFDPKNPEYHF